MIANFAHLAMKNRHLIENATRAGCYHCMKIIDPKDIKEYTDEGKTVLCPHCNVDSVIPDMNIYEFNEALLKKAHDFWF